MRVCVVGGKLQGIEALYLSKKAGFESVLIDRSSDVPGKSLADEFVCMDALKASDTIRSCDVVVPAFEDLQGLINLSHLCEQMGVPMLFDEKSYRISSSKIESNKFFDTIEVPTPKWIFNTKQKNSLKFPVILKPSEGSGSEDVVVAHTPEEFDSLYCNGTIAQEFVSGPSLSLELIGDGEEVEGLVVTQLEFDENYDCKRVFAPHELPEYTEELFFEYSIRIGKELGLRGVMDVEAMIRGKKPEIIEIDARLPSQTPTAVLHCSDVNILEETITTWIDGKLSFKRPRVKRAVIYEHVIVGDGGMKSVGEHVLASARNLQIVDKFHGAEEAIVGEVPEGLIITLILVGNDLTKLWKKREQAIDSIINKYVS